MMMMRVIQLNSFRLKQDKNTGKTSMISGKKVNEVYENKVHCHKLNNHSHKLHENEVYDKDHVHDDDEYDNDVDT